jgi:two-component system, NarL family, sensor kinase
MPEDYKNIQDGLTNYVTIGTVVFIILAVLFVIFILLSVQRRNKMIANTKEIESQFQQTLLQSQLEIQEQTLKTISQEIHDNIGQVLSLAKLNLNTLEAMNDEQQRKQKIDTSKQLVSKAITDLRNLSHSLNTDYVADMGFQRAIEYQLELLQKSSTVKTTLEISGEPIIFDKQKGLILFRIVQEVINNIIKHAQADIINVQLQYLPNSFILTVADNGKGFDVGSLDNGNGGIGLRNMQNRAKLINASVHINSVPSNGTAVKILMNS